MITLRPIVHDLPEEIEFLRAESVAEGFRHVDRLQREWLAGKTRFDQEGEALLGAWDRDAVAGIGGITIDPYGGDALRMRRFYVRRHFRRRGVGRSLVNALLDEARGTGRPIIVNAGSARAAAFWRCVGFREETGQHYTHAIRSLLQAG